MKKKNLVILRLILWLGLAAVLGVLAWLKIVPTGKISYLYDFAAPSYFIGKLTPAERVIVEDAEARLSGDPVYFSLRPPRRFERAKVTVKFKNPTDFPVMEIGLLTDKVAWGYDLKPLQNKIIDQLALVWPTVTGEKGERLIERKKKYQTVEQFLAETPPREEIALYNYVLENDFKLPDYQSRAEAREVKAGFRGSYQFYTYLKNEDLNYVFNFLDLNENKDADPVEVKVFSSAGLVFTKRLSDDGEEADNRDLSLKASGLSEGVYRLSVIANDDIITQSILSPQSRLALINKVWLADSAARPAVLYTNGRRLGAQTINPASLGEIKVGGGALNLNQTYKQFFTAVNPAETQNVKPAPGAAKIELSKADVIISGDGVFAFSQESLLDPRFKTVDAGLNVNREPVNYILTAYQAPAPEAGWLTATAEFDLTRAYRENGKYQFLLSLPGLGEGNLIADPVKLKEIKIELTGTSLWQKLKKIFNSNG